MNRTLTVVLGLLLAVAAAPAAAQAPAATLSLSDALELARENNPDYLATLNDEAVADWGVRAAYGAFLPRASVSGGLSYQGGGEQLIGGGVVGEDIGLGRTPASYFSSYSAGLQMSLSGSTFYGLSQQRAARESVLASSDAALLLLDAAVTRQYLATLRARDAVELSLRELERAEANLSLAEAREAVRSATPLETRQARVEVGRAEVEVLRSRGVLDTEKLRLVQTLGVALDRDVELTTEVRVFEPRWDLGSLLEAALSAHPELAASRASVASAEAGVGMARSGYLPSLSLSAGWSGFARRVGSDGYLIDQAEASTIAARQQCETTNDLLSRLNPPLPPQDCSAIQLTAADRAAILAENSKFPFSFETQPVSVSLGVSVPVFSGLSRQQQVESARAMAEDVRYALRGAELRIRADVEAAYRSLHTAYEAAQLEERNQRLADDQLRLARERYRVGTATFLELSEAETLKARADRAYLLGLYAFQDALAALEQAVGQDLAEPGTE